MALNAAWHAAHRLPRNAPNEERLRWHLAHQEHCGCRPMPARLAARAGRATTAPPAQTAAPPAQAAAPVEIRALAPSDWPALEALFGANGACGGCWCMYWRAPTQRDFRALAGAPAKEAFHGLVTSGTARGVLAFEDGAAVGWCALGPRTDFPRTETKRSYKVADAEGVWSINCFFIRKDRRGRGIAQKLLAAAVAEGRKAGAQTFEGYPSVLAPGAKQPAAFVYKGTLSMFEAAGFRIVQRTYPGSPLVRLGPRA